MTEQTCMYCNGQLEEKLITRVQNYQGRWFMIENVPALVCQQCGEQFFAPDAHDLVVDIVTGSDEPVRIEELKVFNAEGHSRAV